MNPTEVKPQQPRLFKGIKRVGEIIGIQTAQVKQPDVASVPISPHASKPINVATTNFDVNGVGPQVDYIQPQAPPVVPGVVPEGRFPTPEASNGFPQEVAGLAQPDSDIEAKPSYVDTTYQEFKKNYPNIILSQKLYGDKPPIYEGSEDKMEVLNDGQKNSEGAREDRSVSFKLREGGQDKLIFGFDPEHPERLITYPDPKKIPEMSDEQLANTLVLYKDAGGKLIVMNGFGKETDIQMPLLEGASYAFSMDPKTGVGLELVGYDPSGDGDLVVVHKFKGQPMPVAPVPVPGWRDRFIDLIGPGIVGTSTLISALHGGSATEEPVFESPPPVAEVASDPNRIYVPDLETQSIPEKKDPSLLCETTIDYTFEEGDYLTKAIVDANGGMAEYTNPDGTINVDKMYDQLACMLSLDSNREQIRDTDPIIAKYLDSVFSPVVEAAVGKPTARSIREGISIFNTKRGVTTDQLIINKPGDHFKVPVFSRNIPAKGTPENPIPPVTGSGLESGPSVR